MEITENKCFILLFDEISFIFQAILHRVYSIVKQVRPSWLVQTSNFSCANLMLMT